MIGEDVGPTRARIRQARPSDVAAMHRVRMSVQENRLVSIVLSDGDYVTAIDETGRGWVVELEGVIVAFAVGNAQDGSIWALFVEPGHEGRGYGRRLHDIMAAWLRAQGHRSLWLTTAPGTRATGEPPRMWGSSIIGFGKYRYKYESGREGDNMITGFSSRQQSLVLYLGPGLQNEALMRKLGKHKTGKGCLYINKLDDIDRGVLRELIAVSVEEMRRRT